MLRPEKDNLRLKHQVSRGFPDKQNRTIAFYSPPNNRKDRTNTRIVYSKKPLILGSKLTILIGTKVFSLVRLGEPFLRELTRLF
ncbi:hypothetical protein C0J52_15228 [Blattella germanica]|nr:hypothetical protein C0J52_15228 [Blattella germanica]